MMGEEWSGDLTTRINVGQLREAMEGLPDGAQVFIDGMPDRGVNYAMQSQQIPFPEGAADNSHWEQGDPLVTGLEIWPADWADDWPADEHESCRHVGGGRVGAELAAARAEVERLRAGIDRECRHLLAVPPQFRDERDAIVSDLRALLDAASPSPAEGDGA